MNANHDTDPLDALRAADPVRDDHLSSASLARIRARVQEDVMNTQSAPSSRRAGIAATGVGAIAVAALALLVVVGNRGAAPGMSPGVSPGSSIGTGSAMCVEQYDPASLARRAFAFDGTVASIEGDRVTFTVNQGFRGVNGGTVTLDAPGMTGTAITLGGGPNLVVGERYLVAGDATFVWSCGFTQPYDAAIAAEWTAALGG